MPQAGRLPLDLLGVRMEHLRPIGLRQEPFQPPDRDLLGLRQGAPLLAALASIAPTSLTAEKALLASWSR